MSSPEDSAPPSGREPGHPSAESEGRLRSPQEWKAIADRIRAGDSEAEKCLYTTLSAGARFFLQRRLRTDDVGDLVHDIFLTVTAAIRAGRVREPERLMGFVRTILNRRVGNVLLQIRQGREMPIDLAPGKALREVQPDPEQSVLLREKTELMKQTLRELSTRDSEILTRFYLLEQPEEQIRAEMTLTATQFRLLKSRAKARFTERLQQRYRPKRP
jgi:RNA polymerase sigma factor (sigma-70 family)